MDILKDLEKVMDQDFRTEKIMSNMEIYFYLLSLFAQVDNYAKNIFIVYYKDINEVHIQQYEDPIIGYRNDLTSIRSSEL